MATVETAPEYCDECKTEEVEKFCFPCERSLCYDCYLEEHEECEVDGEDEDDEEDTD